MLLMLPLLMLLLLGGNLLLLALASPGGPALAFVDVAARSDSLVIPSIRSQPKGPISFEPEDIFIVTTLDGSMHGIHKSSGRTLWTTQDSWGPLVHVSKNPSAMFPGPKDLVEPASSIPIEDDDATGKASTKDIDEEGLFIPEPIGDGDLYHYVPGMPVKRLPFSIRKMVDNRPFTHKGVVYTSKKVSRLLAIDPLTGSIVRSFGDGEPIVDDFNTEGIPPIMLSRTEYILLIYDFETRKVKWNITYGEFSTASMPKHLLSSVQPGAGGVLHEARTSPLLVSSSVDGLMVVGDYFDDKPYPLKFMSPALGAFDVSRPDQDGNHHLEKVFPLLDDDKRKQRRRKKVEEESNVFIGSLNDTFYVLSAKNSKLEGIAPVPFDPAHKPPSTSDIATVDSACYIGHPDFPNCLLGSHQVDNSMIFDPVLGSFPPLIGAPPHDDMNSHNLEGRLRKVLEATFGKERIADFEDIIDLMEEGWARMASLAVFSILAVFITGTWMNWRSTLEPLLYPARSKYSRVSAINEDAGDVLPQHSKSGIMDSVPMSSVKTDAIKSDVVGNDAAKDESTVTIQEAAVDSVPPSPAKSQKKKKKVKLQKLEDSEDPSTNESPSEAAEPDSKKSFSDNLIVEGSLKTMTVSDEVLGYGSHGTVVFKGTFEARPVAIKRLLVDFYDLAHHEVKSLRDSDYHPNVIRYFYQEATERFMYIALELCPASLYDVIESATSEQHVNLRTSLRAKNTLSQIMAGLEHLHAMKIVHRDIKPQNILVAESKSKSDPHPRIMISDFGLCKRLADDQSSFHNTLNTAGGTVGWRAPECLLNKNAADLANADSTDHEGSSWVLLSPSVSLRITRAIDIFSAGCVFFYVLTRGIHPFGDRFSREINVLKGNHRLDKLDGQTDAAEAKDLIRRMISKDPRKRPDAKQILAHPFFWSSSQKLAFLQDVSDRLEIEEKDPPSGLIKQVERGSNKAIGPDWYRKVDRSVLYNLGKYRKYDGASVQDLLRALRNKVCIMFSKELAF
ncbi:bifunctional endoribonuclease/protein kinase ire1 [Dinochytrium kinnereticum]|nr:bifunctional endoribonuclease/protein kinase ire1 [Dinochytrium kinnereticum]